MPRSLLEPIRETEKSLSLNDGAKLCINININLNKETHLILFQNWTPYLIYLLTITDINTFMLLHKSPLSRDLFINIQKIIRV